MKKQKLLINLNPYIERDLVKTLYKMLSKYTFLVVCISLIGIKVSAQEVRELNSVLAVNDSETNSLRNLIYDLQPVIYFQQGENIVNRGETPVYIDTDVASIDKLYVANSDFNSIEIIRIKINNPSELNLILDTSRLNSFVNLKYILFLCTFDICKGQSLKSACELSKISNIISIGEKTDIRFFYLISIPS